MNSTDPVCAEGKSLGLLDERPVRPGPNVNETWSNLIGRTIELRINGVLIRRGEVEDATADSSVVWLRLEGNDRRQMVSKTDPYEITVSDV